MAKHLNDPDIWSLASHQTVADGNYSSNDSLT